MSIIHYDVIVVGGGPAGLMAASQASIRKKNVIVLEKNRLAARKLLITGKGRCNVTNNSDIQNYIENIPTNPKFLYSSINSFSAYDTINFFESIDVPLKTERGKRVFPVTDRSLDVANALIKYTRKCGAKIVRGRVDKIIKENDFILEYTDDKSSKQKVYASSIIIATGGLSYPLTGSTGDGYRFAESLNHDIIEPKPSLVPIEIVEDWTHELQGLSLKNVKLSLFDLSTNKLIKSGMGEMLFTHFGITGPLVLSASSHIKHNKHYYFSLDLKPKVLEDMLDKRLIKIFSEYSNKNLINSLNDLLPKRLIPIIIKLSNLDQNIKCNQITKENRNVISNKIKNLTFTYKKLRPISEAIITSGGINTKNINPKTMESTLVKGLFFAGEVIDVDAYTGGYNLQIAFSTGYVAGLNA